jgi:hypothetical protein
MLSLNPCIGYTKYFKKEELLGGLTTSKITFGVIEPLLEVAELLSTLMVARSHLNVNLWLVDYSV